MDPVIQEKRINLKMLFFFILAFLGYFVILPFIISLLYSALYKAFPSMFVGKFTFKTENLDFVSLIIQDIGAVIIILVFAIYIFRKKKTKEEIKKCFNKETFKQALLVLGLLYVVSFCASFLIPNTPDGANQDAVNSIIKSAPILSFITVVIIAPIIEELIFRQLLITPLKEKNKYLAIALSAFIFGAIHLTSSIENGTLLKDLPNLLVYVGMGAVLSYKFVETDNIYVPIQGHLFNNLISYIGTLLLL